MSQRHRPSARSTLRGLPESRQKSLDFRARRGGQARERVDGMLGPAFRRRRDLQPEITDDRIIYVAVTS
jgi:hypothetical protein